MRHDALGDFHSQGQACLLRQNDELVAPDTGDGIGVPDTVTQPMRDFLQDQVSVVSQFESPVPF